MTATAKSRKVEAAHEAPDRRGIELSRTNKTNPPIQRTDVDNFFYLSIDSLKPCPLNPRQTFDKDKLQELADSIKAKGVLEPLLVRVTELNDFVAGSGKNYEVIAGERRFRAARIAGLKELPCIIRDLTDVEALEVMVVENEQRADLSPLEKAQGYKELLDRGTKVEDLAGRIGKSTATIYGLVKLLGLPAEARKAVEGGTLPMTTALLVARVPDAKARERAAQRVLEPKEWAYSARPELKGECLTFRDAKRMLEEDFMVELKGAGFDRKSLDLVPAAGSCDACPKRTGNAKDLYPDSRPDVCTDPACYRAKVAAHSKAARERAEGRGMKVLPAGEAKKALRSTGSWGSGDYVDLAETKYDGKKQKTYNQLVGDKLDDDDVVGAVDEKGRLHKLVPRAKVQELLGSATDRPGRSDDKWARQRARDQREREKRQATDRRLRAEIMAVARRRFATCQGLSAGPVEDLLRMAVARSADSPEIGESLAEAVGMAAPDGREIEGAALVQGRGGPELLAMLVYGALGLNWWSRGDIKEICSKLGIDPKRVKADALAEMKAQRKQAAGPPPVIEKDLSKLLAAESDADAKANGKASANGKKSSELIDALGVKEEDLEGA